MKTNVRLLKKEVVASGTMAFHFEKPSGFEYRAGQFGDLTLLNPPETDAKGNTRGFSFVGAPFESDLVVATRMRDTAFKRVLRDLPEGTELVLDAPYGDFRLHKTESTPAVFLAGGIGITPVHSILTQAAHDHTTHPITLLFANRRASEAAFLNDFRSLAKTSAHFRFVPVATQEAPPDWIGERGHINAEMIHRHVPNLATPIYYLVGPEGMVKAMRALLLEMGANEDNIRTEEFGGY